MGPLTIPGMSPGFQKYFISFVDETTRYAPYVADMEQRTKAANTIQKLIDSVEKALGEPPRWLISDKTGKYTSEVVSQMLSGMNVRHIPDIPSNSEEIRDSREIQ